MLWILNTVTKLLLTMDVELLFSVNSGILVAELVVPSLSTLIKNRFVYQCLLRIDKMNLAEQNKWLQNGASTRYAIRLLQRIMQFIFWTNAKSFIMLRLYWWSRLSYVSLPVDYLLIIELGIFLSSGLHSTRGSQWHSNEIQFWWYFIWRNRIK